MPKRPKRPRDVSQLAKLIVDIATGEAENVKPVAPKAAQRKGGLRGGKARAATLTPKKRKAIARKAAAARWRKVCDEIWSSVYAKAKNLPERMRGAWGVGDVWTWTAIDADSKLVPSWAVGRRDAATGHAFMLDLASRLANRVQLTTDGHKVYLEAVEGAFGSDIDYAMLVKTYEGDSGKKAPAETRYSPAECTGSYTQRITGEPDGTYTSTSYAERQNLTMRMHMRRFTRLTTGFSKKVENHKAAVALHFMHYNFARIHKSLRVTPAMEAGAADHVWSLVEIAALAN